MPSLILDLLIQIIKGEQKMKISAGQSGKFLQQHDFNGLLRDDEYKKMSPELESLGKRKDVDSEILQRAYDREDEERDLRVLDAYNRFEAGLQGILTKPETGVMQRKAGAAQSAVFEVNDYFAGEGGRLCDELPDDECRERFMDILASRRQTAINAVAQHQSQQYQNWKERTAAETIDSVLKGVNISPDAASLMHGERLLEGAILRLYRGCSPELLTLRLNAAKQAMYGGAIETIASSDPITALIVAESWKEQLGEQNYVILKEKLEPKARNQSLKMEFYSLRNLEGAALDAELADIVDQEMREELSDMILADRLRQEVQENRAEVERVNNISRELFQKYVQGTLGVEDLVDCGLSGEQRAIWRLIFSNSNEENSDESMLRVVDSIVTQEINEEHQIYISVAEGLDKIDASLLAVLFSLKENPESKLIIKGLEDIAESNLTAGGNTEDHAAAIRDFLHRVVVKVGKGEPFSITSMRNEVVKDHFGGQSNKIVTKKPETKEEAVLPKEARAQAGDEQAEKAE